MGTGTEHTIGRIMERYPPRVWHAKCAPTGASTKAVGVAVPYPVDQPLTAYVYGGTTPSVQLTDLILYGTGDRSTYPLGSLWLNLTDSAGTRTVTAYRDTNQTVAVATGNLVGDGTLTLAGTNGYGVYGTCTVAYTGDEQSYTYPFKAGQVHVRRLYLCHDGGATNDPVIAQITTGAATVLATVAVGAGKSMEFELDAFDMPANQSLNIYISSATYTDGLYATAVGWCTKP